MLNKKPRTKTDAGFLLLNIVKKDLLRQRAF